MSDEIQNAPAEAAESPVAEPGHKAAPSTIGARIDRALDSLKEKNARLVAENQRLKSLLSVAKSATTRISRIPKAAKKEEAEA
jgi:hypothetical protein